MVGIMKTAWDESDELNEEGMLTRSVLSDDYTANDRERLQDLKDNAAENMDVVEDSFKVEDNKKKDDEKK